MVIYKPLKENYFSYNEDSWGREYDNDYPIQEGVVSDIFEFIRNLISKIIEGISSFFSGIFSKGSSNIEKTEELIENKAEEIDKGQKNLSSPSSAAATVSSSSSEEERTIDKCKLIINGYDEEAFKKLIDCFHECEKISNNAISDTKRKFEKLKTMCTRAQSLPNFKSSDEKSDKEIWHNAIDNNDESDISIGAKEIDLQFDNLIESLPKKKRFDSEWVMRNYVGSRIKSIKKERKSIENTLKNTKSELNKISIALRKMESDLNRAADKMSEAVLSPLKNRISRGMKSLLEVFNKITHLQNRIAQIADHYVYQNRTIMQIYIRYANRVPEKDEIVIEQQLSSGEFVITEGGYGIFSEVSFI